MKDPLALLTEVETLTSLLRATSEFASSVITDDEQVHDLIRLIKLARRSSEELARELGMDVPL